MSCLAAMVFPLTAAIISAEMPSARGMTVPRLMGTRRYEALLVLPCVSLPRSFAEVWRASAIETSPPPGESPRCSCSSATSLLRSSALVLLLFPPLCGVEKRRPLPLVLHAELEKLEAQQP